MMRWTHWRNIILTITILMLAIFLLIACSPAPDSDKAVIASFKKIAESQRLPEQEEIYKWWVLQSYLSKVSYIKERNIYEIQFPTMDDKGVEIWAVDINNSRIIPLNYPALLMAMVLFCKDKTDNSGDCQTYFRQLDVLKQQLGK